MAFTVAQLTVLEEAIASGSLEVTYEGKTIKYPSFEDLQKRYEYVRAQLVAGGQLSETRTRASVADFSKD
jgi:hypothetical protein